jgi:hypothetical protein
MLWLCISGVDWQFVHLFGYSLLGSNRVEQAGRIRKYFNSLSRDVKDDISIDHPVGSQDIPIQGLDAETDLPIGQTLEKKVLTRAPIDNFSIDLDLYVREDLVKFLFDGDCLIVYNFVAGGFVFSHKTLLGHQCAGILQGYF